LKKKKKLNWNWMRVGVVGGGISGLSAAYYLSRFATSVNLIEASSSFGGWLKSARHVKFNNS